MAKRMNWERCRHTGRARESKYEPGKELSNGAVVAAPPSDKLAMRAARAAREWRENLSREDREFFFPASELASARYGRALRSLARQRNK